MPVSFASKKSNTSVHSVRHARLAEKAVLKIISFKRTRKKL